MNNKISILFSIVVLFISTSTFAGFDKKSFELPNHGVLLINVPSTWIDQIKYPPGGLPPTIRFSQKTGEKFVILFTPMWKMPMAQANFGTPEGIKQMVEGAALNVSTQAVEKNIKVKEIGGPNVGFYFSATDKAPKPDEYKFMNQGAVGINEIVGTFTILTNSLNSPVIEQAIKMFGSLKHSQ